MQQSKLGFIQGRLSPLMDDKIQAFPSQFWQKEFSAANDLDLRLIEWTLDQENLYDNPIMTSQGREEIRALCNLHGILVPSLTGDCFMQFPFWKLTGNERAEAERDFVAVLKACGSCDVSVVVVPLVDNGAIDTIEQEEYFVTFICELLPLLDEIEVQLAFESDYSPEKLLKFINRFSHSKVGINYDMGNSAALNYDPEEEIVTYGHKILNVHVKDRALRGTTVPLGTGNVDFGKVFNLLAKVNYNGNLILQTARAKDDDHCGVLSRYKNMLCGWVDEYSL